MLRDGDNEIGIRVGDHPDVRSRRRPLAAVTRFGGHVALVAVWVLVVVLGLVMWGPRFTPLRTDVIIGQSMEPTIPLYSVIVVEPVPVEQLRSGDIITFEQPEVGDRKVTHRIERVERRKDGRLAFVTKGDNNEARDPWRVTYEGSGYRVRTHVPHVGWLILQAQTPVARIGLVVLPALVLLVAALRWVWGSWGTGTASRTEDDDGEDELDSSWDDWERVA